MAERKAQQKYYPPDYDPAKHGGLNKYHGTHHLRDRARKLDQGILIIRFELPYNVWCLGCDNMIAMSVRFNAEKKKIGMYYTTPIWSFRMKCPRCKNWWEIHTDPKNTEYVCVSGVKRKNEQWTAQDTEVIQFKTKEQAEKLETDPMFRVEYGGADVEKARGKAPSLLDLKELQGTRADTYTLNKQLRAGMRTKRKETALARQEERKMQAKLQVSIPVLPEAESDVIGAKVAMLSKDQAGQDSSAKRDAILAQSIFTKGGLDSLAAKRKFKDAGSLLGGSAAKVPKMTTLAGLVAPKKDR